MPRRARYSSRSSFLQVLLALLWGTWLGLTPSVLNLHTILLLFALVFLRLPWVWMVLAFLISWSAGAFLLDPYIDQLGQVFLGSHRLEHFWGELAKLPLLPWTRYNNSMVLGAFVLGLLSLPLWSVVAWKFRRQAPSAR